MASEEATRIIDLYQRKALDWIESRARASLFEKPWLDRFRALLPPGRADPRYRMRIRRADGRAI